MGKNDKKRMRTMVYSNVNKKAGKKSASKNKDVIDLDDEIIIGLKTLPKPNLGKKKKKGQVVKNKKSSKQENNKKLNKSNNKLDNEKLTKPAFFSKKIEVNSELNKPKLTKQQKIKLQKRKILMKIGMIVLLIICLIGGGVYFALSPVFSVKTIDVINNTNISPEYIKNMSEIKLNENTFKFSKKEVKDKILLNPYIEDVNIKRNVFANKVQIDVKERIATLMLEYGNSYVYINNQGYILEISTLKLDSPIIKGYVTPVEEIKPGNRLNKDDLDRLGVVLKILEVAELNDLEKLITNINVSNKKDYVIIMESEDKTIYLGTCSDLSTQMLYVKEMIQREKGKEGDFFINKDINTSNPVFREKV